MRDAAHYQPWTSDEDDILRRWYARRTACRQGALHLKRLARALDRTYASVVTRAGYLGLRRPRPALTPEIAAKLRRWHEAGIGLNEMGRRLHVAMRTIKNLLRQCDIKPRGKRSPTPAETAARLRSSKKWLQTNGDGYRSLREVATDQMRREAQRRWPCVRTLRQADAMDVLASGVETVVGLREAMGLGGHRAKELLRQLIRLGAVVLLARGKGIRGGGSTPWRFGIAEVVRIDQ